MQYQGLRRKTRASAICPSTLLVWGDLLSYRDNEPAPAADRGLFRHRRGYFRYLRRRRLAYRPALDYRGNSANCRLNGAPGRDRLGRQPAPASRAPRADCPVTALFLLLELLG